MAQESFSWQWPETAYLPLGRHSCHGDDGRISVLPFPFDGQDEFFTMVG